MNNHYGISHTIGLGDINAGIASQNNEIHRINTQRLADFQAGKAKEISNLVDDQKQQAVSAGVEGLSQYINKGPGFRIRRIWNNWITSRCGGVCCKSCSES